MFKIEEAPKLIHSEEYADARACCGGLAVFIGTIVAIGVLAGLIAGIGIDLRSLGSSDAAPPAYAQLQPND
jgi:hypothetical protein